MTSAADKLGGPSSGPGAGADMGADVMPGDMGGLGDSMGGEKQSCPVIVLTGPQVEAFGLTGASINQSGEATVRFTVKAVHGGDPMGNELPAGDEEVSVTICVTDVEPGAMDGAAPGAAGPKDPNEVLPDETDPVEPAGTDPQLDDGADGTEKAMPDDAKSPPPFKKKKKKSNDRPTPEQAGFKATY